MRLLYVKHYLQGKKKCQESVIIYVVEKEDTYIKFADVLEVFIESLDHVVDEFEHAKLIDVLLHV